MKISKLLIISSFLFLTIHSAQAIVYKFEDLNANNGGFSDRLDTISSTYDSINEIFTWDVTFNADPTDVDGFWLVVNNGPNPKSSDVNELAIMYGDMDTGTLTTYAYNGANNSNSWNTPGIFLQTDLFTVGSDSISIDIDVSAINAWNTADTAPDYTGIAYDDMIGIWFHISTGSSFSYSRDELTGYSYASQGWYDKKNLTTTVVPEPALIGLLCLGFIGIAGLRIK